MQGTEISQRSSWQSWHQRHLFSLPGFPGNQKWEVSNTLMLSEMAHSQPGLGNRLYGWKYTSNPPPPPKTPLPSHLGAIHNDEQQIIALCGSPVWQTETVSLSRNSAFWSNFTTWGRNRGYLLLMILYIHLCGPPSSGNIPYWPIVISPT